MATRQRYKGPGADASVKKLRQLGFDPMEALVQAYEEIDLECKAQADIRDKKLVRLRGDGKPKAYDADFHMACIERRSTIADKLLRYKYARVPENESDDTTNLPSLNINLTTDNKTFTLNPQPIEDNTDEAD